MDNGTPHGEVPPDALLQDGIPIREATVHFEVSDEERPAVLLKGPHTAHIVAVLHVPLAPEDVVSVVQVLVVLAGRHTVVVPALAAQHAATPGEVVAEGREFGFGLRVGLGPTRVSVWVASGGGRLAFLSVEAVACVLAVPDVVVLSTLCVRVFLELCLRLLPGRPAQLRRGGYPFVLEHNGIISVLGLVVGIGSVVLLPLLAPTLLVVPRRRHVACRRLTSSSSICRFLALSRCLSGLSIGCGWRLWICP
mmetsp:Transcript_17693/g.42533  ORF Transcript_17693/g.42533 Transcript_17693/m.42533 type:complete len:251 (+) Transcript_17693:953-1705(+)